MIRFLAAFLLVPTAAGAATGTAALDRLVAAFVGAPAGVNGGAAAPIDTRLRLADCAVDPVVAWRSDRHDAVTVSCPNGWRLFVAIKGAALPAAVASVRAEPVIRRGDPVSLAAGNGAFSVSTDGIAMSDAAPGARVLLKVDGAKAPVQAIAIEAGRATLPGW